MLVDTKAYGQIEVDERQRITIPSGLYGFDNMVEYILMNAQQHPFYWLQSLDVRDIAFVLIDPEIIRPDYKPCLDPIDLEALKLNGIEDERLLKFAIVTIPDDHQYMTANLQGPVILNRETRVGRQCISSDESWQVRHNIMEEIAASSARNAC